MAWGAGALGLLAVAALAGADPAPHADPWIDIPTVPTTDFDQYYPDRARRMRINGWARLRCVAQPGGRLTACQLVGEAPSDYSFGNRALLAARVLRVGPSALAQALDWPAYYLVSFETRDGTTPPDVVIAPQASEIEAARPPSADPVGMARLRCEVPASGGGLVTGCQVLFEGPAGQGFGLAATSLAARAYRVDRKPLPARVRFRLGGWRPDFQLDVHVSDTDAIVVWRTPPAPQALDAAGGRAGVMLNCAWDLRGALSACRVDEAVPRADAEAALSLVGDLRLSRPVEFNINFGQ